MAVTGAVASNTEDLSGAREADGPGHFEAIHVVAVVHGFHLAEICERMSLKKWRRGLRAQLSQ